MKRACMGVEFMCALLSYDVRLPLSVCLEGWLWRVASGSGSGSCRRGAPTLLRFMCGGGDDVILMERRCPEHIHKSSVYQVNVCMCLCACCSTRLFARCMCVCMYACLTTCAHQRLPHWVPIDTSKVKTLTHSFFHSLRIHPPSPGWPRCLGVCEGASISEGTKAGRRVEVFARHFPLARRGALVGSVSAHGSRAG